ncbi:MAG: isoprenylcysteine carboxylmethyltransferase family protein [Conexibacter sp.]|jgi:protein-S-isoprenylcysteine O-methyltransferase Ste14|nr:isoprenylcysteine carboxylmethyltransferase family protein [Conexibacter sp.]
MAAQRTRPGRRPTVRQDGAVHRTRVAAAGSAAFFLAGPGLEAGLGPWLLAHVAGSDLADWPVALRVLGGVLIVAGLAVLADVFVRFVADGAGTPSPAVPTQRLLARGAFAHVRHPMYVATATVIVGEALAFAQPILLVGALAYLAAMGALAGAREDPRLARRFGAEYDAYRRAVPGWWPRLRPWRGDER